MRHLIRRNSTVVIGKTFSLSIPLVAIIHAKTGRNPLDLFNSHIGQLSKEIELVERKKLPAHFLSDRAATTEAGEDSGFEPERAMSI